MRALLIFISSILLSINLNAQVSAPKYSNEFLAIGVGARGQAMGRPQLHPHHRNAGYGERARPAESSV